MRKLRKLSAVVTQIMFDAFIDGLLLVLQWKAFSLMLVGMTLGFFVGLLPGIGGKGALEKRDIVLSTVGVT